MQKIRYAPAGFGLANRWGQNQRSLPGAVAMWAPPGPSRLTKSGACEVKPT